MESALAQEGQHLVEREDTSGIQDVVADQGDSVVTRDVDSAVDRLQIAAVRIELDQSRQPCFAEQSAGGFRILRKESADGDAEGRLIPEHAGIRGAVKRRGIADGVPRSRSLSDQRPPFLTEYFACH